MDSIQEVYAVIFTSTLKNNTKEYYIMAERMMFLASQQTGFIEANSARNEVGITVSYWSSVEAIHQWKNNAEHLLAQQMGKENWYANYCVQICKILHSYKHK